MINIILLGAPGAGKGTQANKLSNKYSLIHISTGDMIREEIKNNTIFGKRAKMFSDKGLLVPDELVIEIIENKLDSVGGGYLFDGFPRNVKQAEAVDEIVKSKSIAYPLIFYIDVSEDELIKRLTNRRYCPNCNKIYNLLNNIPRRDEICDFCGNNLIMRKDDVIEVIKKRLEVFCNETYPLLEYYSNSDKLYKIDGNSSENEVYNQLVSIIDDNIKK